MTHPLAQHTLADLHDCDPALLRSADDLKPLLLSAIRRGGGTIVTEVFHNFSPHGVSGVIVIAESHVAIHTWPERGFAALDLFSCSPSLDRESIAKEIASALRSIRVTLRTVPRGE